jgi:hypothetical protein
MFCYIEVRCDWMPLRTPHLCHFVVLITYVSKEAAHIPYITAQHLTCCRIVRQVVSMPTFAPSVTILCPDRLAGNAGWMPLRTLLIFVISLRFRLLTSHIFSCHVVEL